MGWRHNSRRRKELPANWQQLRREVLYRDGGQCVFCGNKATDVDHIDPHGPHDVDNLRALCHHCHMSRTQEQSVRARQRGNARPAPHRPASRHPGLK